MWILPWNPGHPSCPPPPQTPGHWATHRRQHDLWHVKGQLGVLPRSVGLQVQMRRVQVAVGVHRDLGLHTQQAALVEGGVMNRRLHLSRDPILGAIMYQQ